MSIVSFWKENKQLWIPITDKDKAAADKLIYETYYNYDSDQEPVIGRVIYLDQFQRHFHRHLCIEDEAIILEKRELAHSLVKLHLDELVATADEIELVYALMPAKHLGHFDFIFDVIYNKWSVDAADKHHRLISDYPILSKFHNDTYKKTYTFDKIKQDIACSHVKNPQYDPNEICDFYPEAYKTGDNFGKCIPSQQFFDAFASIPVKNPIISLSGGVDSMVMLALFRNFGKQPTAVHIIYGNREVSEQEFHFVSKYCGKLNVPLYSYRIPYLRRANCDREFYEQMTRDMRFHVYRAVGSAVFLGHIREDVIENIWTNISKAQHLTNLKKMVPEEIQNGITIVRPMLNIDKAHIYEISRIMSIPYLKNTTPGWSNRGKFRERFYAETHRQFGPGVDEKLMHFAETLQHQSCLIERLIYKPIYDSFSENRMCIDVAVQSDLGRAYWNNIFEHACHHLLGKSKPSTHAINEFVIRLQKAVQNKSPCSRIQMKKEFQLLLTYKNEHWFLEFIYDGS